MWGGRRWVPCARPPPPLFFTSWVYSRLHAHVVASPPTNILPSGNRLYWLLQNCSAAPASFHALIKALTPAGNISCTDTLNPFKALPADIDALFYNGYWQTAGSGNRPHEYAAAYDFRDTSVTTGSLKLALDLYFNLTVAHPASGSFGSDGDSRVGKYLNLATNAFLRLVTSNTYRAPLMWIRDQPQIGFVLNIDISSLIGKIFYVWVSSLPRPPLFPP